MTCRFLLCVCPFWCHSCRPEYIGAFYNVINWAKVGEYYATAASGKPIEF